MNLLLLRPQDSKACKDACRVGIYKLCHQAISTIRGSRRCAVLRGREFNTPTEAQRKDGRGYAPPPSA
jgi:hypothetical protein